MKKLNAVGANIFAGGFTVGVSKHFNVLAHLEHDDYGVAVTKANFPKMPVVIGTDEWPEKANKPIHFLYSNPPCAIWSLAGNKHGRIDWRQDPRLQRVRDIFALVDRYRPQVWCWESVCQAFEKGREFVEELADEAAKLGYSATYLMIDAMYLRAPQTRKRFFLVLHRVAIDWEKFRPDFDAPPVLPRDVLRGVKPNHYDNKRIHQFAATEIGKQMITVLKATPPGGRLAGTFEEMVEKGAIKKKLVERKGGKVTTLGKPSFLAYRINPDQVLGVIFGDKTFHHKEPRHLALNELGVLHGFPPEYNWVSNFHRLDVQRGVLPPVGEWLARVVAAGIKANRALKKPTRTFVDFRRAPGTVQDVLALPRDADLNWRPGKPPAAPDRDELAARGREGGPKRAENPLEGPRRRASARGGAGPAGDRTGNGGKKGLSGGPRGPVPTEFKAVLAALARGERPPTSGLLIRARILEGKLDDEAMAAEVRKLWPGRTTSKSDVAWNRGQLRKAGVI